MPMAPPPAPSPIMRVVCPLRELAAVPGPAQAPATPPVPDRETRLGPAVVVAAALALALAILPALVPVVAVAAEAAPVEAINRAPDRVTLTVLAAAINPAVVGTNCQFR